jgi:hypothetical protein
MTGSVLSAGYYNLLSVKVFPFGQQSAYEIGINMIPSLSIASSIDSDFMTGVLNVIDASGFIENAPSGPGGPLRGEERVVLTVSDTFENEITFDMFCHKIDDFETSEKNDYVTYKMHLVSYQAFLASKHRIIRAFNNRKVSQAISTLFDEYYTVGRSTIPFDEGNKKFLSSNKSITVQDTDNFIRCTIPNLTPGEAINFLSRKAYSTESASCSFRFFENTKGFYFVSDEKLLFEYAAEPVISPPTTGENPKVFYLTYFMDLSKDPANLEQQMNNLTKINHKNRVNTLSDMYGGAYRNKVILVDILNGSANIKEPGYSYIENRSRYNRGLRLGTQLEDSRHSRPFIDEYFNKEVQQTFLVVKDYDDSPENTDSSIAGQYHYDEIISNRLAFRRHMDSVTISASGPGRLDITAGNVIYLDVPAFRFASAVNTNGDKNEQLSGYYVVKSVVHEMNQENMTNLYVLAKTSWDKPKEIFFSGGR